MLEKTRSNFNPRPHKGDDINELSTPEKGGHFNPRPHKGDDFSCGDLNFAVQISIHVPTRGTTIHVPTRGTTKRISIHVPTRGTTAWPKAAFSAFADFNPRPHKGDDFPQQPLFWNRILFQSTSPQGGRPIYCCRWISSIYFNPRPHKGDDQSYWSFAANHLISIHVPTRGTTAKYHKYI